MFDINLYNIATCSKRYKKYKLQKVCVFPFLFFFPLFHTSAICVSEGNDNHNQNSIDGLIRCSIE